MPTRDDVELLVHARNTVVGAAQDELVKVFSAVEGKDPETIRNVLIEAVPAIVGDHGNAAAVAAAADWYMQLREKDIPGAMGFQISLGEPVADDVVRENVRYASKFLFGSDPAMTITALHGAIGRHVKYAEMSTIRQMGTKDTLNVRFALVPRPPMTCAWCSMLSSRGWVYESEVSARGAQHTGCDCSVVPSWDSEKAHIDGYDPELDYRRYKKARDSLDSAYPTDGEISKRMREMFPDDFTDGMMNPGRKKFTEDGSIDYNEWRKRRQEAARQAKQGAFGHAAFARRIPPVKPDKVPDSWPDDLPTLKMNKWNHILYGDQNGGGHLPGHEWWKGGTPFPSGWSKNDISAAMEAALRNPDRIQVGVKNQKEYVANIDGHNVLVVVASRSDGTKIINSAYIVDPNWRKNESSKRG